MLALTSRNEARQQADVARDPRGVDRADRGARQPIADAATQQPDRRRAAGRRGPPAGSRHAGPLGAARAPSPPIRRSSATPTSRAKQLVYGAAIPGTDDVVVALDGQDLAIIHPGEDGVDRRFGAFNGSPPTGRSRSASARDGRRVAQLSQRFDDSDCRDREFIRTTDGAGCALLSVYDIESGRLLFGPMVPPLGPGDVDLNADGSLVAVAGGFDGDVAVYRVDDGALVGVVRASAAPRGVPAVPRHRERGLRPRRSSVRGLDGRTDRRDRPDDRAGRRSARRPTVVFPRPARRRSERTRDRRRAGWNRRHRLHDPGRPGGRPSCPSTDRSPCAILAVAEQSAVALLLRTTTDRSPNTTSPPGASPADGSTCTREHRPARHHRRWT